MRGTSTMSSLSEIPFIDGKSLLFQPEWLQPTENDFHSRSRVQCTLLSFYQSTIIFLSQSTPQTIKEHPKGKRFFDQLKLLASLDINQALPLRVALGWLWKAYLNKVDSATLMTAASWLLDQLRSLIGSGLPPQTSVFIQITSAVFATFGGQLGPFKSEYYKSLIKMSVPMAGKEGIAIVASESLLEMITLFDDSGLIGDLKSEIIGKIVPNLISSNVADLQSNSSLILCSYFEQGNVNLGYLNRKSIKSSVEKLFDSPCNTTKESACRLFSKLISFQPNGKPQSIEKLVKSWIHVASYSKLRHVDLARILVSSALFKENMLEIFQQILPPRDLSLPIIPESKRRKWIMEPGLFKAVLLDRDSPFLQLPLKYIQLFEKIGLLGENLTIALLECIFSNAGHFEMSSAMLESILECTKEYESGKMLLAFLLSKSELSSKQKADILSFLYAQAKMEFNLFKAGDSSSQIFKFDAYLSCLAGVIVAKIVDSSDSMADLFESSLLLSEIKTWSLSLMDQLPENLQTSYYCLLGAFSISHTSFMKGSVEISNTFDSANLCYYYFKSNVESAADQDILNDSVSSWWKHFNTFEYFKCIDQICIKYLIELTKKLERIPTDAASFCTRVISTGIFTEMELQLSILLASYFDFASFASQKYHLGLLREAFMKKERQASIFATVTKLVEHLHLENRSIDEVKSILSLLADIVFPFVTSMEENIANEAGKVLVNLINISKDSSFGTAIFEELMERSLNEENDFHIRGYIGCIGYVYSCINCSSHFDINATVGFLSSMAKDVNSIMVRTAALSSLSQVLKSYSLEIEYNLTLDVIYLIWQIYMEDENSLKSFSYTISSLIYGIEQVLPVLYELLGSDLLNGKASSVICRMILWSLLARSSVNGINEMSSIFDCYIKLLVVSHEVDDFSLLLKHIGTVFANGDKKAAASAVSCLRWLLSYYPKDKFSEFTPFLLFSLLRLNIQSPDLDFCVDLLMKGGMQDNPSWWINRLQDSNSTSVRKIETFEGINDEKPLVNTKFVNMKANTPLPMETLCQYLKLITENLSSGPIYLKDDEASNELMATSLRLAHSFLLRCGSPELKILGVRLVSVLTLLFYKLPTGPSFLQPYFSQIMTFYSSSLQDEDIFVRIEAMVSFTKSITDCQELRMHGKCKQILNAATKQLLEYDSIQYFTKNLEIYLKCKLATNILQCARILKNDEVERNVAEVTQKTIADALTGLPNESPSRTAIEEIISTSSMLKLTVFSNEEKLKLLFLLSAKCSELAEPSVKILVECSEILPMANIAAKSLLHQIIKEPNESLLCEFIRNIQSLQSLTEVSKEMLIFSLLESAQTIKSCAKFLQVCLISLDPAEIALFWSVFFDLLYSSFAIRKDTFTWIFDRRMIEKLTQSHQDDLFLIILTTPLESYEDSLLVVTQFTSSKFFSILHKKLETSLRQKCEKAFSLWSRLLESADRRQRECAIACIPTLVDTNSMDMELSSHLDPSQTKILKLLLSSA